MGAAVHKYFPQIDQDMRVALLLVTPGGVVLHADPDVRALFGRSPAQCEGRSLDELIPSIELLAAMREVHLGIVKRCTLTVGVEAPVRRLLVSLSAVRGVAVEPMVAVQVTSMDDYREERQARAAVRLRATIESVIAGFAHEVRNPIAAILSITEAALTDMAPAAPATSMLTRIPGLVNRVDKLIKESLHYSRPRSPKRAPRPLRSLVDWSIQLAQMEKGGIDFDVSIDESVGAVLVDAEQIEQVIVNLLCNARDAARRRVQLTARREAPVGDGVDRPSRALIEVTDDGAGVAPDLHERIFEPFFTTKAHGTGLGLAIARDLSRLNGGELELYASSDRGTTFSLYLEEQPGLPTSTSGMVRAVT